VRRPAAVAVTERRWTGGADTTGEGLSICQMRAL
jgi:hypothetical protein